MVVIPTRNRPDLAIAAIESVLNQKDIKADIILSDNSTDESAVEKVASFCRDLNDPRVHYVRPVESLPMPAHWRWALDQALELSDAEYVTYLTDRSFFLPTALRDVAKIIDIYPGRVITYSWDQINDSATPIISFQLIRTGKVFEIASTDLLDLAAEGFFNHSLPRMLNNCCPRATIEKIKKKYGSIFFTDVPDFNFAYTCMEVEESILYIDYPLFISYGIAVSNGIAFFAGLFNTVTAKDFIKNTKFDDTDRLVSKLPLSNLKHIAFEYAIVKKLSENNLRDLDENKLLRRLLSTVIFYQDSEEKKKALRAVYSINKVKFPLHLACTYFSVYKERGVNKLRSRMMSDSAFEIVQRHRTLGEAMTQVIHHPRSLTNSDAFFETRIGRFPRELDFRFDDSPDKAK